MSNELTDIMLVNIRLINKTSQRLNRGHAEHNGLAGSFPPVLSENNVDLVQFKARPHLSSDILIQSGIKKTLFEARSTYAEGTITILNRPRFPRHSPGSLRNAFQTLPVTADC